VAKLIAREGEDGELVTRELLNQLIQLGEVPRGRASQRRSVLDEENFPAVGSQRHFVPCSKRKRMK
jgi:hypothetical protein